MRLLTIEHTRRMMANGRWNKERSAQGFPNEDFRPVAKIFCPWNTATWLLTELDPEDLDIAYGLCDFGFGHPELGKVRLSKLAALRGPGGLRIERDRGFRAVKTLGAYAIEARTQGRPPPRGAAVRKR